ncbi:MAG: hypothetical protein ACRD6X_00920, partial [Pyrinomonadaceae bacterium]
ATPSPDPPFSIISGLEYTERKLTSAARRLVKAFSAARFFAEARALARAILDRSGQRIFSRRLTQMDADDFFVFPALR